MEADQAPGITFDDFESVVSSRCIKLMGYEVSLEVSRPVSDGLELLRNLAPLKDMKLHHRVAGVFAYSSQWVAVSSDKRFSGT
ncbi:hypothetical protein PHET_10707 [Paragonimus heterotremus]|uniref:Uncharacterized protein n=1 Tax=Paragonimus heterotremus TaxID=100268 RepID=A0A8J4WE16_9TREM|nr:hypothetical protein PHET_10707 [Paragonimus heterotremus]